MLNKEELLIRLQRKKDEKLINDTTYNKYLTAIKYFNYLEPQDVPIEYKNTTYFNFYITALKSLGFDYTEYYNHIIEREKKLKRRQEVRIYPSYLELLQYLKEHTSPITTPERYRAMQMTYIIAINGIRQATLIRQPLYKTQFKNEFGIDGELMITYVKRNKCYFFVPKDLINEIPYKNSHLTYYRDFMTQLRRDFNITWDAHEIFRHSLVEYNKQTLDQLSVLAFEKWRVLIGHEVNKDVVKYYLDNDGARLEFAKQYYNFHLRRIIDYVKRWC